jgi:hypothetical protein
MRVFLIALFFCSTALEARASSSVILMVNMNYSSKELEALKEVGKRRGQEVIMIPPESLIPLAERMFHARDEMEKKVRQLRPNWKDSQVRTQVADFMRHGGASDRDNALTSALSGEVNTLHRLAMDLSAAESRNGPVEDQLRTKAAELRRQRKRVDTFVFSAHSDGTNLSGESSNRLSSSGVTRLAREFPELFKQPRHVLLLGCYNMTETNHFRWRHDLFSNASLVAGFGVRAPSRYRPISAQYVRDVLNTADALDDQMIASGPLDRKYVENVFKKLAAVTNTQSVLDYCLGIIEGQPGARSLSCEEQWTVFRGRADTIHLEYLDLRNMTKDPSQDDSVTELRDFYNLVQATCPARNAPQIPRDQVERAERYRTSVRETLIRLIYWWNVQKNFRTYFSREFDELSGALRRAGISETMPALDGTTGRVEFVKRYNAIDRAIRERKERARSPAEERAARDAEASFRYFYPLFALEGEEMVGDTEKSGAESTLSRGGIPFHWIEGGAVLEPRSRR